MVSFLFVSLMTEEFVIRFDSLPAKGSLLESIKSRILLIIGNAYRENVDLSAKQTTVGESICQALSERGASEAKIRSGPGISLAAR
jgi:hypothetical protein